MNTQRDNSYHKPSTLCEECGNTSCGKMDICYGCINKCVCLAKKEKENLTMEENPIKITIDNYCGQKITFTMSEDAEIESLFELDTDSIKITHISINAYDNDILIEKEDLI